MGTCSENIDSSPKLTTINTLDRGQEADKGGGGTKTEGPFGQGIGRVPKAMETTHSELGSDTSPNSALGGD